MKGFRQQPQNSRKERLRELEVEVKNLAMAGRISQMMTQQLMQNMKALHEDLGRSFGIITELQYKILAMQKASGLDVEKLNAIANEQRLTDFCEASDKEDAAKGFTSTAVVAENSTVILTSTTEQKDAGIFRSRLKLSECGVPDLIKAFMGREVGAKAIVSLNGVDHEIELLAIRQPTATESVPTTDAGTESDVRVLQPSSTPAETQGAQVVGNA